MPKAPKPKKPPRGTPRTPAQKTGPLDRYCFVIPSSTTTQKSIKSAFSTVSSTSSSTIDLDVHTKAVPSLRPPNPTANPFQQLGSLASSHNPSRIQLAQLSSSPRPQSVTIFSLIGNNNELEVDDQTRPVTKTIQDVVSINDSILNRRDIDLRMLHDEEESQEVGFSQLAILAPSSPVLVGSSAMELQWDEVDQYSEAQTDSLMEQVRKFQMV